MSCGRPPASRCLPGVSQGDQSLSTASATGWDGLSPAKTPPAQSRVRGQGIWPQGVPRRGNRGAGATPSGRHYPSREQGIPELAVMANVLNPETESTTLNTELETPTLEPATELEQPSPESTSNPETAEVSRSTRAGRRCPNRACSRGRAPRGEACARAENARCRVLPQPKLAAEAVEPAPRPSRSCSRSRCRSPARACCRSAAPLQRRSAAAQPRARPRIHGRLLRRSGGL